MIRAANTIVSAMMAVPVNRQAFQRGDLGLIPEQFLWEL
jgi:hypothetical protein